MTTDLRADGVIFIEQPLGFVGLDADLLDRDKRAKHNLEAACRDVLALNPKVVRAGIGSTNTDGESWRVAQYAVVLTNVTRPELDAYCQRLTTALTGENPITLTTLTKAPAPEVYVPTRAQFEEVRAAANRDHEQIKNKDTEEVRTRNRGRAGSLAPAGAKKDPASNLSDDELFNMF